MHPENPDGLTTGGYNLRYGSKLKLLERQEQPAVAQGMHES